MRKALLAAAIACAVVTGIAQAQITDKRPPNDEVPPTDAAPEIDPNMAFGGVAALAGGLMVLRHYRRRK